MLIKINIMSSLGPGYFFPNTEMTGEGCEKETCGHSVHTHPPHSEGDQLSFDLKMPLNEGDEYVPEGKHDLERFDWKHGFFRRVGIPLWAYLLVQFITALLMTVIPPVISYLRLVPGAYPLISMSPPVKLNWLMELLRPVWLLGVASLVYVGIHFWLCLIPWFTFKMAHLRALLIEDAVRHSIEQTWNMRHYFGAAGASVTLAIFAKVLYPLPVDESAATAAAASTTNATTAAASAAASKAAAIVAVGQNLQNYFHRPYQFFVANGCLAIGIIACVLLVEKMMLKAITHRYQSHSLESRIQTNKFARKVTRSIKNYIIASEKLKDRPFSGPLIIDYIGQPSITKDDLAQFMDDDVAAKYFALLDPDLHGSLNREQFIAAIDNIYNERNAIDRAFMDQCHILDKFDRLMMVLVWLLGFLTTMVVMDPPIKFLVTFSLTIIGGAMFMFRDTAKKAFDSIVFVIFTHPFDADDWIMIKDDLYQVHEVGLWTSTFVTSEGKLVYIANRMLVNVPITNLRRSPVMSESIIVNVMPSTTQDRLSALDALMQKWIKHHARDYASASLYKSIKLVDRNHLRLEIQIKHKANFNDQTKKDLRTRKFVMKLKEAIKELGIELSPPLHA